MRAMYPRFSLLIVLLFGPFACQNNTRQLPPDAIPPSNSEKVARSFDEFKGSSSSSGFEDLVADYESKDRVIWQKPDLVISLLNGLEGKTVADIGAGTGYFAFRLVPKAKKVIAVDIDPRFIDFMDSIKVRLPEAYQRRFETRLAKPNNPMLAPEEVDAVIVVNTYGYLRQRVPYLKILLAGMKPQATLLVIDFKKNSLPIGPSNEFKVALIDVMRELEAAGFQITQVDQESLDYQYIVIAQKP